MAGTADDAIAPHARRFQRADQGGAVLAVEGHGNTRLDFTQFHPAIRALQYSSVKEHRVKYTRDNGNQK